MYKIVKKSEAAIRQIAPNKIASNFITNDISPNVSFATTEATDYYEQETTRYDRIYYVLSGEMEITIGKETNKIEEGDACFMSKDTLYEMRGTFKAVVVNQPAFGS